MLTTLPLLVAAVWRWASTEQRVAQRAEALADAAAAGAPPLAGSVRAVRPDPGRVPPEHEPAQMRGCGAGSVSGR